MSLRPAELKCYLVVTRAIQRDRNGGELSIRRITERANLSPQHAHRAIAAIDQGLLLREGKPTSTAVYSLPVNWVSGRNDGRAVASWQSDCSPTGEQLKNRNRRKGEQHLKCSESRKAYWFRVPNDEELLMSLRPAELKCYRVVRVPSSSHTDHRTSCPSPAGFGQPTYVPGLSTSP